MVTNNGKVARAIPRRRRSEIWTVADSLINKGKNNIYAEMCRRLKPQEAAKLGEGAKSTSIKQRKDKKTREVISEEEVSHYSIKVHRRASRLAEKEFIGHLWIAWRKYR